MLSIVEVEFATLSSGALPKAAAVMPDRAADFPEGSAFSTLSPPLSLA
jgi:hypothetical protein